MKNRHLSLTLLPGLALLFTTILAYQPVWHAGFVWDDHYHVEDNHALVGSGAWKQIWLSRDTPQYYPLVFSTFRLERALWGLNPTGYHWVNLLLHAANALLLWQLLRRLRVPGAWLAGAIFALHPVNVETVAWITERKNTLSMFFFLLSLLFYWRSETGFSQLRNEKKGRAVDASNSTVWYWLSWLSFLLALFSKTAVAPLPVVLLGLVWWQRGRLEKTDLRRSLPFFLVALLLIPLTVLFEHQAGSEIVRNDGLPARLAGAGWGFWFYLWKAVWPTNLMFVYPRWRIDPRNAVSYVPGLLVLALLLLTWRKRHGWGKAWLLGLSFFGLMLLPALGLINIYFMIYSLVSDHWQYVAIVGPITLVAAGMVQALDRWGQTVAWLKPIAVATLLLALGLLTFRRSALYVDDETLWRGTIRANPDCWMAYNNLGVIEHAKGNLGDAITLYQKALQLRPKHASAHSNLGNALRESGRLDESVRHCQQALELEPGNPEYHFNLGLCFSSLGKTDDAMSQFQAALKIQPDYADALCALGDVLHQKGQDGQAIAHYQMALKASPTNATAHNNLGEVLRQQGRLDEAVMHFRRALELDPENADIRLNLGLCLSAPGQADEAVSQYQDMVQKKPNVPAAQYNLGRALASQGKLSEALQHLQRAVELDPNYPEAHNDLGIALATQGRLKEAVQHFERALQLKPAYAEAHNNYGIALVRQGMLSQAIEHFQQAVRLKPDYTEAHNNLATALADQARGRPGSSDESNGPGNSSQPRPPASPQGRNQP